MPDRRRSHTPRTLLHTPQPVADDKELARCLRVEEVSSPLESVPVPLPFAKYSKAADRLAFVVDDLLSAEECSRLIRYSSQRGYEPAMVGSVQVRKDSFRKRFMMPNCR